MFNVSALLLDDALKPATPLTNGTISENLLNFVEVKAYKNDVNFLGHLESWKMTQYPQKNLDRHHNLIDSSFSHAPPVQKTSVTNKWRVRVNGKQPTNSGTQKKKQKTKSEMKMMLT